MRYGGSFGWFRNNTFHGLCLMCVFSICLFRLSLVVASEFPSELVFAFNTEKRITVPDLKRFLVMNQNIAQVVQNGSNLLIKSNQVGETSLILWIESGKVVVKLKVNPPEIRISEQTKRIDFERLLKNSPIITVWSSYSSSELSHPLQADVQTSDTHVTGLGYEMPLWNGSRTGFDTRWNTGNDTTELENWTVFVTGLKVWRHTMEIYGGAVEGINSQFAATGPLEGLQVNMKKIPVHKKYNLDIGVAAGRHNPNASLFGGLSASDQLIGFDTSGNANREEANSAGVKFTLLPVGSGVQARTADPSFRIGQTDLILVQSEGKNDNADDYTSLQLSHRGNFRQWRYSTELGGDLDASPSYNLEIGRPVYKWNATVRRYYKEIGARVGGVNITGFEQNLLQLSYFLPELGDHMKNTSVFVDYYTSRREELDFTDRASDWGNYFDGYSVSFRSLYRDTSVGLSYRAQDSSDTQNPLVSNYATFNLGKPWLIFNHRINLGFQYNYHKTERPNFPELDVDHHGYSFNLNIPVFRWLNYGFLYSQRQSQNLSDSSNKSDSDFNTHSVTLSHSLFRGKVSGSLNYSHTESNADEALQDLQNNTTGDTLTASLSVQVSPYSRARFSYQILNQESSSYEQGEIESQRFEASLYTRFHTLFGWKPKVDIGVQVFKDIDGDGKYDPDIDRIFASMPIVVNGEQIGFTNDLGYLSKEGIKAFHMNVELPYAVVPEGYIFSTPQKIEWKVEDKERKELLFGIALHTEVSGVIFNDVNENGEFDEEDVPIKGIEVQLSNGKMVQTNLHGWFSFTLMPEGDYTVKLNPFSIPEFYRSTGSIKREAKVEAGTRVRMFYPLKAQRKIEGQLYYLPSKQKKALPIAGATVTIGQETSVTDSLGQYKIKQAAYGNLAGTITLPAGNTLDLEETFPYQFNVQTKKEGGALDNQNFLFHER